MKKILFVDDEQRILQGLERMLRVQRDKWEMTFVDSGQAALVEMAGVSFDVIVSDMRMPGMDGATLLARVHELYPRVVRIVLSGHAELEAAMRAIPVTHQFLTKPCALATRDWRGGNASHHSQGLQRTQRSARRSRGLPR